MQGCLTAGEEIRGAFLHCKSVPLLTPVDFHRHLCRGGGPSYKKATMFEAEQ